MEITGKIIAILDLREGVLLELSSLEKTIKHCVEILETGDKFKIFNM